MADELVVFEGKVTERDHGENNYAIFLDDPLKQAEEPFALDFAERVGNRKQVSVQCYFSESALTEEERIDMVARMAVGMTVSEYSHNYSELTGYLWTDEDVKIGGHDLLAEVSSHVGKWARVEVTVHN